VQLQHDLRCHAASADGYDRTGSQRNIGVVCQRRRQRHIVQHHLRMFYQRRLLPTHLRRPPTQSKTVLSSVSRSSDNSDANVHLPVQIQPPYPTTSPTTVSMTSSTTSSTSSAPDSLMSSASTSANRGQQIIGQQNRHQLRLHRRTSPAFTSFHRVVSLPYQRQRHQPNRQHASSSTREVFPPRWVSPWSRSSSETPWYLRPSTALATSRVRRVDSHYFVYFSSFTITSTNSIVFTITFVHCTTNYLFQCQQHLLLHDPSANFALWFTIALHSLPRGCVRVTPSSCT
jgi:hypothetical protein